MTTRRLKTDRHVQGRVIITDPKIIASLRPSPEAMARIERLERSVNRPRPPW